MNQANYKIIHYKLNYFFFFLLLFIQSSCKKDDLISAKESSQTSQKLHTDTTKNNQTARIIQLKANAGNDTTLLLPNTQFKLNARQSIFPMNSFDDGIIIGWRKLSGPASTQIVSPLSTTSLLSLIEEGIYLFEFNMSFLGQISRDTIKVTVIDPNAPPTITAFAGNDTSIILPSNTILLNGSGYTQYGTITNYEWRKIVGNGNPTITSPNTASTSITGLEVGIYMFELKVTNNSGYYAIDSIRISVKPKTVTLYNQLWNCAFGCSIYFPSFIYLLGPGYIIDQIYIQEASGSGFVAIYTDTQSPCLSGAKYCYWINILSGLEYLEITCSAYPPNQTADIKIEYH